MLTFVAAAALLGASLFFPTRWAEDLPRNPEAFAPPPISGTTLLRLVLAADAVLLAAFGLRRPRPAPAGADPSIEAGRVSRRELVLAGAVSALAMLLRLHRAGSDLWIDEIVNLTIFRDMPPLHVVAAFRIANNHVLNTLLVKVAIALGGESEAIVRLPAILFGAATVPVLFAASRRALGAGGALCAALLLAVSYHHVYFSQNARGYSAHVFFAILAASALAAALRTGRRGAFALYAAGLLGGTAALLHGFFVLAGHAVLLAGLAFVARRRRTDTVPLRRAALALAAAAWGSLHLSALSLPDAFGSVSGVYRSPAMGYKLLSLEHVQEWGRGLAAGAGPGGLLAALVFVGLAAAGFHRAQRRDPILLWGLASPLAVMSGFVVAGHLNVTPRTFLLGLPLGIVCAVSAVLGSADLVAGLAPRWPRLRGLLVAVPMIVLMAGSGVALAHYYRFPKQDFRGALKFIARVRQPRDLVLAVYLAKIGCRYYGPGLGLEEGRDFVVVQSVEEAERARTARSGGRVFAVVTLARATRMEYPDLDSYVRSGFRLVRSFPGTLGDGEVSVWEARAQK
jgi:hypothetical protein